MTFLTDEESVKKHIDVSIVVPLFNEDESLKELTDWIDKVMMDNDLAYEILLIDDGSKDNSWKVIEELSALNSRIHGMKFRRNYGKSAALYVGFAAAKGDVVITMDADLQDSPDEIPELYKMIMVDDFDVVSGWKKKRHDPLSKRLPSKFFNYTARIVTGIRLHDFNCGLKAYRKSVIKSVEVYGEMHRYIPVLAKQAGFINIGEKIVQHYPRKFGVTKFGIERFINGFLDLFSVIFISKFSKKPMHFFGLMGIFSFFIGFGILFYLAYQKIVYFQWQMTDRPLFYFGLLGVLFGTQLFLTGFLAELISRSATERNTYQIEKEI